jgi:hypothetical protein
MANMFNNLQSIGMQPERIVVDRIKTSIGRYVECFNLTGLTGQIQDQLGR